MNEWGKELMGAWINKKKNELKKCWVEKGNAGINAWSKEMNESMKKLRNELMNECSIGIKLPKDFMNDEWSNGLNECINDLYSYISFLWEG